MPQPDVAENILFVHAHPDDESLFTGGTIAQLVRCGASVTVLTLTRGELGEVMPGPLKHLESTELLADHREDELRTAMTVLGVADQRYLGNANARTPGRLPRKYRDSGMVWAKNGMAAPKIPHEGESVHPESLSAADGDEIMSDVLAVVHSVKPTAIVSYNQQGGYGHPDHIIAHEISVAVGTFMNIPMYAIESEPSFEAQSSRSTHDGESHRVIGGGVEVVVELGEDLHRKMKAIAAHASQVVVRGTKYMLSGGQKYEVKAVEYFRLITQVNDSTQVGDSEPRGAMSSNTAEAKQFQIEREYSGLATEQTRSEAKSGVEGKPSVGDRIRIGVVGLLVGVTFGVLGTIAHQSVVEFEGFIVPYGLVVALLAIGSVLISVRLLMDDRVAGFFCAVGIVGIIAVYSFPGPGGSVLIPANIFGVMWTVVPPLLAAIVMFWPALMTHDPQPINRLRAANRHRIEESPGSSGDKSGLRI